MYSDKTEEQIKNNMLNKIKNTVDKSENSLVHDAIAPVAIELAQVYMELGFINDDTSFDTAIGDALTELTYQNGTLRKEGESDETLRERHKQRITNPPQDGNQAQYRDWADRFEGIGIAKVFPLWDGGNTVKVAITNKLYQVAEPMLVNSFQEHLDPNAEGLGNGVALLGVKVTVTGGAKKEINITGNIILAEGYTEPEGVSAAISEYLASITYIKNSVSYMRTAVSILDSPSIVDLNNFTITGGTTDITLVGEEIPILYSINLMVLNP